MNTVVVGVLRPGEQVPAVDRIFSDEASIRRLVGRFPAPTRAGPATSVWPSATAPIRQNAPQEAAQVSVA